MGSDKLVASAKLPSTRRGGVLRVLGRDPSVEGEAHGHGLARGSLIVEIGLADDEIEQAPEGFLGEIETLGSDEINDAFSASRLARRWCRR